MTDMVAQRIESLVRGYFPLPEPAFLCIQRIFVCSRSTIFSMARAILNVCIFGLCFFAAVAWPGRSAAQQAEKPIPVGLDAYRQWYRWPEQRIGMRAYMRSTYDRNGGNENADGGHFLYQLADDFNVTLDVEGPGILVFSRFNHWHGSPWHFVVDGKDHVVRESSTADPLHPDPSPVFLPTAPFPAPLNLTWAVTKGSDLIRTDRRQLKLPGDDN